MSKPTPEQIARERWHEVYVWITAMRLRHRDLSPDMARDHRDIERLHKAMQAFQRSWQSSRPAAQERAREEAGE